MICLFLKKHSIVSISSPISTPLFHSLRIFYADNKCTLYAYGIYMYVYVCGYRNSETSGYPTRCFMQLVQSSGVNCICIYNTHTYVYVL